MTRPILKRPDNRPGLYRSRRGILHPAEFWLGNCRRAVSQSV